MTLKTSLLLVTTVLFVTGCLGGHSPHIPSTTDSVAAGGTITRGGTTQNLIGTPITVGLPLPDVSLVDINLSRIKLADLKGQISIVSVAPSLDTQVCERQTHELGDAENIPEGIRRVTITRDLPFAQKRFDDHTGFDILYLSDYYNAGFGQSTGLLVEEIGLLARALMVVDKDGIVRYLQVVPELTVLPDMNAAIAFATELATR